MSKKVLVLTGSARKNGNSDMLADAFIKGAESKGHKVTKFICADYKINGCLGCNGCWSTGKPCVQKDDFNEKLAPLIEDCEVLVLCGPLYSYTFSAQLKSPLDRLFPYGKEAWHRALEKKATAMIVCGADDQEDSFDPIIGAYRHLFGFFEWDNLGEMLVLNVNDKGEVKNTDGLQRAEAFGGKI